MIQVGDTVAFKLRNTITTFGVRDDNGERAHPTQREEYRLYPVLATVCRPYDGDRMWVIKPFERKELVVEEHNLMLVDF